jgi:hypothetical protein
VSGAAAPDGIGKGTGKWGGGGRMTILSVRNLFFVLNKFKLVSQIDGKSINGCDFF